MLNEKTISVISKRIKSATFLVIGDLILDRYIEGTVERISPEAPVPVVLEKRTWAAPGGAANVALNLKSLGAQVTLTGLLGNDEDGNCLQKMLEKADIYFFPVVEKQRPTTVKTRVSARNQQLIRIDREITSLPSPAGLRKMLSIIHDSISRCKAIILSDYAKGTLTPSLFQALQANGNPPVYVDPKPRNFRHYKNFHCLLPNASEAAQLVRTNTTTVTPTNAQQVAKQIVRKLGCNEVVITLGEHGAFVFCKNRGIRVPARTRRVFDVTGAGDTFTAAFAAAETAGLNPEDAALFANLAAGIVVERYGPSAVSLADVKKELKVKKILNETTT